MRPGISLAGRVRIAYLRGTKEDTMKKTKTTKTTKARKGEAKPADKPATEPCGECLPCLVSFADGCANPIEFGGAK